MHPVLYVSVTRMARERIATPFYAGSTPVAYSKYMPTWCNGSIPVSKTVCGGSNPSVGAIFYFNPVLTLSTILCSDSLIP